MIRGARWKSFRVQFLDPDLDLRVFLQVRIRFVVVTEHVLAVLVHAVPEPDRIISVEVVGEFAFVGHSPRLAVLLRVEFVEVEGGPAAPHQLQEAVAAERGVPVDRSAFLDHVVSNHRVRQQSVSAKTRILFNVPCSEMQ